MRVKQLTIRIDDVPHGPDALSWAVDTVSNAIRSGRIPDTVINEQGEAIGAVTVKWETPEADVAEAPAPR